MRYKQGEFGQKGFTLIELMIATAVLSTILLLATIMMANIGRLYQKGITQAKMQQNIRAINDDIAEQLKLNSGPATHTYTDNSNPNPANPQAWCIGTTRYTYIEHVRPSDTGYKHILWRDFIPPGTCKPARLTQVNPSQALVAGDVAGTDGTELLTTKSRISHFTIAQSNSSFDIAIAIAYGDDELLQDPNGDNPRCLGGSGGEFCATAELSTRVVKRVTD